LSEKQPNERLTAKRENWNKAFAALEASLIAPIAEPRDSSGIVKDFEIVYELSWKTLKNFLQEQGHETTSDKDVFKQAYQLKYLSDEATWLSMIADRNLTVHTYDEALANELCARVRDHYVPAFRNLKVVLEKS